MTNAEKLFEFEQKHQIVCDCGEGWGTLIADLDAELKAIDPDYRPMQVKEKFGGLRFYADANKNFAEFNAAILRAEVASFHVCEVCGNKGDIRSRDGWFRTMCEECD